MEDYSMLGLSIFLTFLPVSLSAYRASSNRLQCVPWNWPRSSGVCTTFAHVYRPRSYRSDVPQPDANFYRPMRSAITYSDQPPILSGNHAAENKSSPDWPSQFCRPKIQTDNSIGRQNCPVWPCTVYLNCSYQLLTVWLVLTPVGIANSLTRADLSRDGHTARFSVIVSKWNQSTYQNRSVGPRLNFGWLSNSLTHSVSLTDRIKNPKLLQSTLCHIICLNSSSNGY